MGQLTFGKVVVEREIPVAPERVFAAFADATEREKWGAPSDTAAFIVEQDEFRVGGTDITRCGAKDDPRITVTTHYLAIREPNIIICTDTVHDDGTLVATMLKTVEITGETHLRVAAQIASLVGEEMVQNTEQGQNGSLDRLIEHLSE